MKRAQSLCLQLHRWIGLVVGVLLLVEGASGATLVFHDEIERILHSELVIAPRTARRPAQALVDTVHDAHPGALIERIEFPERSDQAVLFTLSSQKHSIITAVDPYRNRIVRDGPITRWPMEWLFDLHQELLSGSVGETIVGIEGVALLFMAVSGPIVWWPGARRLKHGFRLKLDGSTDLRWRTLHRAVGAAAAVLLILSATTGVLMVWKGALRTALGTFVTVTAKPNPRVALQAGQAFLPVDGLVTRARTEFGRTPLRELRFTSSERVVAVFLDSDLSSRPNGTKQIYYNAYTGEKLGQYIEGRLPAGSEAIDWLFTVHTGAWGGIVTRILLEMTGFVLVGLSASGMWLWLSRTSRRRKRSPATGRR